MLKKYQTIISKVYKYVMAVFTVLLGVAILICVCHIFFTGPLKSDSTDPFTYSPEKVGFYLKWLSIPFILYVVLVILGTIFYTVYPQKENAFAKPRPISLFKKIKSYDLDKIENVNNKNTLKRNKYLRIAVILITSIIIFVSLFVSIWFLKNEENYILDSNVIKRNIDTFLSVLPFIVISLVWGIASVLIVDSTAKKDIQILKEEKQFKLNPKLKVVVNTKTENVVVNVARIAIAAVAITFIVLGIFNGGMKDVFIKAINICTECIGLG